MTIYNPEHPPSLSDDKDKATGVSHHVEDVKDASDHDDPEMTGAIAIERIELEMGLWESLVNYKGAVCWSLLVSMCIIMEGYDLALVSNLIALDAFRTKFGVYVDETQGYQISAPWQSAVTQAPTIGAFFGVLIAAWMAARLGYKWTLQLFMVFMTAAIFVVFFSTSLPVLFVGQFLCGVPWGAFSVIPTAYASEVAPVRLRVVLTSYVQICWCAGQFVTSGVTYGVKDMKGQWAYRIPFALQWVWPAFLIVAIAFAPESPWWLIRHGRIDEARKSLKRLGKLPRSRPDDYIAMMVRTIEIEKRVTDGASYKECFKGTDLRRTLIVCCAHVFANLTGLLVSNLGTYFFVVAGLSGDQAYGLGLGNTGLQLACVLLSIGLSSRFGRRTLVMWGLGFNCVCLLVMGILACLHQSTGVTWAQGILVIIIGAQWGLTLGPMCWTIVGETSSLRLRALTVGLSRDAYYISSVVLGILNAYMLNPTGWGLVGKTGFFYLGTCSFVLVMTYFFLPELRGRSYREIDILFRRHTPGRQFAKTVVDENDED